jgi:hypothetical protein
MRELLGEDGYATYGDYEKLSYYRVAYVEPLSPLFSAANASLSVQEKDQLVRIIAANDHPRKLTATDVSNESQIDWDAVVVQAGNLLNPEQIEVIRSRAGHQ